MHRTSIFLASLLFSLNLLHAENPSSQVQVEPPPVRHGAPPSYEATAAELEKRGDELRAEKAYLDALDYYDAAIKKNPSEALLYNKAGITELQMQRTRCFRSKPEATSSSEGTPPGTSPSYI